MPFISVIVPTMRVGGIDVLLDSLQKQTFTDFELVLVDAIGDRRRDLINREARDRFLCVRHAVPEPSPFPMASFCVMANIGIAVSTGEVILFAVDYTRFRPDTLEKHARFHMADPTGRAALMGPYNYVGIDVDPAFPRYGHSDAETDRYGTDVKSGALDKFMFSIGTATDQPSQPHHADGDSMVPHDCDPKLRMPIGRIEPTFFHAKNESVRRERVLEIDGFDQDLDGTHLYQDSDFADRLSVKAGVQWLLDPAMTVDIINPRSVFPFAKRVRDFRDNERIWQTKKAAGYPAPANSILVGLKMKEREAKDVPVGPQRETSLAPAPAARKLRVVMIYGEFCKPGAPFDLPGLYRTTLLTGSELSFFNAAIGLSELGHEVLVACKCEQPFKHPSGLTVMPLPALTRLSGAEGVDAVITWNEPDYLRFAPASALKINMQQLNDWAYCHDPSWSERVDVWAFPSHESLGWHVTDGGLNQEYAVKAGAKFVAVPSSTNLEHFTGSVQRVMHRAVWASSADRGLHHLLDMWPDIRARVPSAELRIFYELRALIERVQGHQNEVGRRARLIAEALPRLEQMGVTVVGPVDSQTMAKEFQAAAVLPFTCDVTRHTETFAGAVLDACAGGCLPIVSDVDCIPSVHGFAARVIPGNPAGRRAQWIDEIVRVMKVGASGQDVAAMRRHAENHSKQKVAAQWAALIGGLRP